MINISNEEESESPRFSPEVEQVLRQAGWFPGRVVPDEQLAEWSVLNWQTPRGNFQTRMFPAAWRILREFGGLAVVQHGPGVTCSRLPFVFDPLAVRGWGLWDEFAIIYAEWEADSVLFPLGYYSHQDTPIAVDMRGMIVSGDEYRFIYGASIDEAIHNFIIGIDGKPLRIEPWKTQESGWANFMRAKLGLD